MRRVFRYLQVGMGPRRSPSACPKKLLTKHKSALDDRSSRRQGAGDVAGEGHAAQEAPADERVGVGGAEEVVEEEAFAAAFFFHNLGACRRRIPEDPCRCAGI